MSVSFVPIPTEDARRLQSGNLDAYGNRPERRISDGKGIPCRHCLKTVPKGSAYLIAAYRPFRSVQPYAETGPIFLCAELCKRAPVVGRLPEILSSKNYIVRGYDHADRIVYGTGFVVPTADIPSAADVLLSDGRVTYVHVRSASNNCFQCRVDAA